VAEWLPDNAIGDLTGFDSLLRERNLVAISFLSQHFLQVLYSSQFILCKVIAVQLIDDNVIQVVNILKFIINIEETNPSSEVN
jgi:hypothetical protein